MVLSFSPNQRLTVAFVVHATTAVKQSVKDRTEGQEARKKER
jgi:hypothetical protein